MNQSTASYLECLLADADRILDAARQIKGAMGDGREPAPEDFMVLRLQIARIHKAAESMDESVDEMENESGA
jgi:uncharacterized protein Yka (UPF0111/DUF47 family)